MSVKIIHQKSLQETSLFHSLIAAKTTKIVIIEDRAYKNTLRTISLASNQTQRSEIINRKDSFNWYDISIKIKGYGAFEKRYAGRVETGNHSKRDPLMGRQLS